MQAYSEACVYLEPSHIQNQKHMLNRGIFRTVACSEPEAYSQPCQASTRECFEEKINGYYYLHNISFSLSLLHKINYMNYFDTGLIFTPKEFILCKISMGDKRLGGKKDEGRGP